GASGETEGRPQPAPRRATVARTASPSRAPSADVRLLVMVDPTVRLDEADDPRLVEVLERVEARPRGEREPAPHRGIGREDDILIVPLHDRGEFRDQLRTLAIVLDMHSAVLELVYLELGSDPPRVPRPGRDVG